MANTDTEDMLQQYAKGGLVSKNAMSDYFLASAGKMTEMEFVGKHKMSTLEFEKQFAEDNSVDITGTEKLSEVTTTPKGIKMDYSEKPKTMNMGGLVEEDPVSGNEIPPGSTAEEVRDNIPAMLSENEYVIPADVLKFFGVNFFEKLRTKAKQGMLEMEDEGRMGGEPVPAAPRETIVETMAEGGLVAPPAVSTFNPADFATPGFSGASTPSAAYEYREVFGPGGASQMILFVNGVAAQTIPPGFSEAGPEAAAPVVPEVTAQGPDRRDDDIRTGGSSSFNEDRTANTTGPLDGLDFNDVASIDSWAAERLEQTQMRGLGMLGGVAGLAGTAINKGSELRDIASVSAAARYYQELGDQESSDRLMGMADEARERMGLIGGAFEGLSDGERIFDRYVESLNRTSSRPETLSSEASAKRDTFGSGAIDSAVPSVSKRDTDDNTPTTNTTTGKTSGTDGGSKSTRRNGRTDEEARNAAKRAADRQGVSLATGGRNKGGLVTKRKTKKK